MSKREKNAFNPAASRNKTRTLVYTAVLLALILLLGFVPNVGYITVGPVQITLVHIPVIIGACLFGPLVGGILGGFFGLTSFFQAVYPVASPLWSPLFFSYPLQLLLVCLIPRILTGVAAAYTAKALLRFDKKGVFAYAASGVAGSVVNTLLFISSVLLVLGKPVGELLKLDWGAVVAFWVTVGLTNGIPEAIVSGVLAGVICKAVVLARSRRG